jgi:hypothetical protein
MRLQQKNTRTGSPTQKTVASARKLGYFIVQSAKLAFSPGAGKSNAQRTETIVGKN